MALPVTYLFVPGDRPERFDKALAAGADAVIIDLEDAVKPGAKEAARRNVCEWAPRHPEALDRLVVRINDAATPWFEGDLRALTLSGVRLAMLAKAESRGGIESVLQSLPAAGRVLPLVETPRGVASIDEICATPGVQRVAFGTIDYAVALGLSGDERGLIHPSSVMAVASRCAGIESPVAGVTASIDDEERIRADLAFARAFGFGAKLCIHPRQVQVVREAMRPTAAEVDWARRVVAAAEAGSGAVQVDGRMVDRPVIANAQDILERASR